MTVPFIEGRPFAEALRKAKSEKKNVLLDIYAVWCAPCKLMDRTTFSDKAVGEFARTTFVSVKMDAEKGEGRRLAQRYMISSFPTVLVLDPSGNEIDRMVGVYPATSFLTSVRAILAGQTPLLLGLAALKKQWSPREAAALAQDLIRRHDVARLRPIVVRLVSEDADLGGPDAAFHLLTLLAALEDFDGKLNAETADLVATMLPRAGADPRRGALALLLSRDQLRRGETAAAKATAVKTLEAIGDSAPYAAELWAAVGAAERKAGRADAAVAACRKAVALSESGNAAGATRGERQMDLADALVSAGKASEARAAMEAGLERWGNDPKAFVRASKIALALKSPPEAVAHARRAVALSQGEDASSQAALAAALTATGDASGAAAAWRRAAEIDPENVEYRRGAGPAPAKKPAAGAP